MFQGLDYSLMIEWLGIGSRLDWIRNIVPGTTQDNDLEHIIRLNKLQIKSDLVPS